MSVLRIRLLADYGCYPTWRIEHNDVQNVAPETLALPPGLSSALAAWSATYESTLDDLDPASSGFDTQEELILFGSWGHSLARWMTAATGLPIDYFDVQCGSYLEVREPPLTAS